MKVDFNQALIEIENDKVSGSTALADKIILLLINVDPLNHDKASIINRLEAFSKSKPFFSAITHVIETLKNKKGNWPEILTAYKKKYDQAYLAISNNLKPFLWTHDKAVLLHSRSKTILTVFEHLGSFDREFKIYQTQSLPEKEGIIQAAELHDLGFSVELIQDNPEKSILNEVGLFITGADLVLPDQIINKSGTKSIAEKMKQLDKPYYVLTDTRKFSKQGVNSLPPDFESIPRSLVSQVITE